MFYSPGIKDKSFNKNDLIKTKAMSFTEYDDSISEKKQNIRKKSDNFNKTSNFKERNICYSKLFSFRLKNIEDTNSRINTEKSNDKIEIYEYKTDVKNYKKYNFDIQMIFFVILMIIIKIMSFEAKLTIKTIFLPLRILKKFRDFLQFIN